jgi:hypothetical protein
MEGKDTLGRSKEGREWGACLSVVAEGVSAWGWVQVVSHTLFGAVRRSDRIGTGTCAFRGRDEERRSVLGG